MDQTTRKFLALLGSDTCDAVCRRLAEGEATQTELVAELGVQSRDVGSVLDELLLVGLVRWRKESDGGRGRPGKLWRLRRSDELERIEAAVREMRVRLLDADDPEDS